MDNQKTTEFTELALEALRDLEDAVQTGERRTINLKIEVLRQALFNILENIQWEQND